MNSLNKRFTFDVAGPEDGQSVLQILETAAFKGQISLLYTRRPDAYQSFLKEGKEVELLVCRDQKDHAIAGFGAYAIRHLYVNGRPERVAYIFGLRANGAYLKSYPILHKAYGYLYERLKERKISFCLTTILEENAHASDVLLRTRTFMPSYEFLRNYEVYALKTGMKAKNQNGLVFRMAEEKDIGSLVEFLNNEGKKHQFFPVMSEDDLRQGFHGLTLNDFYIVLQGQHILAAGAVWDQRSYKQYVVYEYKKSMKVLQRISEALPVLKLPFLPKEGEMLNFFTLSFWAVKDNQRDVFNYFIENLSKTFTPYSFFLVGLCEDHPFKRSILRKPHIVYKSKIYLVDWIKDQAMSFKLDPSLTPYLECGSL